MNKMVLSVLKEETRDLHKKTEALFFGKDIFSGQLTYEQYSQMILKNLYIYEQLEKSIDSIFLQYFSDIEYQPFFAKHKWLEEDAKVLNLQRVDYSIDVPAISSPEELLGAIYVLEGATLGGKIIGRKLKEIFPVEKVKEFHFYNTERGNEIQWRNFCVFITKYVHDDVSIREATKGAIATFKFFHDVYKQ